jgi:SAM-dependent methyltransferase
MAHGLQLDRVVLLGRTREEYRRFFGLQAGSPEEIGRVLDVAAGVSSFCAESVRLGADVTAVDPIYAMDPAVLRHRCERDLAEVVQSIAGLPVYRWDFYGDPAGMARYRERAYRMFLEDFDTAPLGRYVTAALPELPFPSGCFDLTLVSYFLLVYQEHFSYEFHGAALRELMRVTRGELRLYPAVTFAGERSRYLERWQADRNLSMFQFTVVPTDFEFLVGSNAYVRVRHRAGAEINKRIVAGPDPP